MLVTCRHCHISSVVLIPSDVAGQEREGDAAERITAACDRSARIAPESERPDALLAPERYRLSYSARALRAT